MALGDQSKALRIVSKAKGWDPAIIPAKGKNAGLDMSNFDKAPDPWDVGNQSVGKLPQGTPMAWPDNMDNPSIGGPTEVPFAIPATHDTPTGPKRATSGADPFSGMGNGSGM